MATPTPKLAYDDRNDRINAILESRDSDRWSLAERVVALLEERDRLLAACEAALNAADLSEDGRITPKAYDLMSAAIAESRRT